MIEIKATAAEREFMVQNVIGEWLSATSDQHMVGRAWYRTAHSIALMIADGDVVKGAGLLAALSPQTEWFLNIELAADAFENGAPSGHFADALRKARRILAGEDPLDVLPMARKTGHFYRCIVDPTDAGAICIDRHAHDIAVGTRFGSASRGLDARGRYELIADTYREAARRLGELPLTVQAVTWVSWRENA